MKLVLGIIAPLGVALYGWFAVYMFTDTSVQRDIWGKLLILALSGGMIVVLVLGLIEVLRCSLTIHSDRLQFVEIIGERVFALSDIQGYRVKPQGQGVYLVLKSKPRKKINVPSNLERFPEIIQWLDAHFTNLDALEFKSEEEEILADADLGLTPDERKEKLEDMRRLFKQSRWIVFPAAFWAMMYPQPYALAITVTALLPAAGIVLIIRSHGLIHIDDDNKGAHPSAMILFIPGMVLAYRAFADYNIVDFNDIWIPLGVLFAVLGGVLFWKAKEYHDHPLSFWPVLFILIFYAYGLTIHGNCILDGSEPTIHGVTVREKRISNGRPTLWYLKVSPWGTRASHNEIQVIPSVYNSVRIGDTVHVKEKSGLVGVRWFYTRRMDDTTGALP